MTVMRKFEGAFVWRRVLDDASIEHATLAEVPGGFHMRGTIVAAEEGRPLRVDYTLDVDAGWTSRAVQVVQILDGVRASLALALDGDGRWRLNGAVSPALDGCTDIDLSLSPITNALPMNRLALPPGGAAEIRAAWVLLPQLRVEPSRQRYERLSPSSYRYTSVENGFTAVIAADEANVPVDYEGVWKRIATGRRIT